MTDSEEESNSSRPLRTEPLRKPCYLILGDEQGIVLDQLKKKVGRPLLSEPRRDRTERHNWYFFKGDFGVYWWLGEGNESFNHQFMIVKNPIVVMVINYRYAERDPVEKLNDYYKVILKELIGNSSLGQERHPELKLLVVGYKFQNKMMTHKRYKKAILNWCIERQKEIGEDFCDYMEDWVVENE